MDIKQLYQLYQQHPVITTDSRNCPEGSIFLALKGESFDGNKFAQQALEKGCAYAIVDEDITLTSQLSSSTSYHVPRTSPPSSQRGFAIPDHQLIKVDNCLQTFKDLAREHRRQFDIPVIGITGTNGKTTTKELVRAVLAEEYNVLATEGNFNNDVGVPKTLFRLTEDHDIAIIEMGASHPGDIKTLVETAEPTCGLITNVGRAHLQGFGSFEGVKQTKGELYDFLRRQQDLGDPDRGFIFINADDPDLTEMADSRGILMQFAYGTGSSEDIVVRGEVVSCDPFLTFRWWIDDEEEAPQPPKGEDKRRPSTVSTNLIGAYNIYNMLAAIAVGLYFDVDEEQINHALSHYQPTNNRSQLTQTAHNTLIVDAYNANPTSMSSALHSFASLQTPQTKLAILGDMRELGEASPAEHQRIVDLLDPLGLQNVWLVGEEFGRTNTSFRKFSDVEEVKKELETHLPEQQFILLKGSNSMRLFSLVESL